jgi:hypothetical protein
VLLYVGISPKAPAANGRTPSRQNLRTRLRYHMRGNAEGSTLRLTLGCLLADELGLHLRRVGSGKRFTFCDGEKRLSDWLVENAKDCISARPRFTPSGAARRALRRNSNTVLEVKSNCM